MEAIALVTEDEIRGAMRYIMDRLKIIVEPSGAVSVAAVMFGKVPLGTGKVGIMISGGNTDLDFLKTL